MYEPKRAIKVAVMMKATTGNLNLAEISFAMFLSKEI